MNGGALRSRQLRDEDYRRLHEFRIALRDFLRWSEESARGSGLTPAIHQLLLVVRGHPTAGGPTIGDAAQALHMRHHSAVELAQRAESAGLLTRKRAREDSRRVRLGLTALGHAQLDQLTRAHLPRIGGLAHALENVVDGRGAR